MPSVDVHAMPEISRPPRGRGQFPRRVAGLLALLVATLLLSSVALINRYPLMFFDSKGYWRGGQAAVDVALGKLDSALHPSASAQPPASAAPSGDAANSAAAPGVGDIKAVRSPFYSLFLYLTERAGSFWTTIVLQGLATAIVLRTFLRSIWGADDPPALLYLSGVAILTVTTSVAWFSSEVMPDLFAGLVILDSAILAYFAASLSMAGLAALIAFQAFAITTHTSHLTLALGLCVLSVVQRLWSREGWREAARTAARTGLPIVLAAVAAITVSYAGFHQLTVAPLHPPFLLARTLADGPTRWYLQHNCPDPRFVMCDYAANLPTDTEDFLWGKTGIYSSVSPAVRARIRAEEMPLVLAAAKAYPFDQFRAAIGNTLALLGHFGTDDFHVDGRMRIEDGQFVYSEADFHPVPGFIADIQYAAVVAAVIALLTAFAGGDRVAPHVRRLIVFVAAGLVINAGMCGAIAGVFARYQARVVWVLPALALAVGASYMVRTRKAQSSTGAATPRPTRG